MRPYERKVASNDFIRRRISEIQHINFGKKITILLELNGEKVILQKLDYIHNNPIRIGWVNMSQHYLYSSASNYFLKPFRILKKLSKKIQKIKQLNYFCTKQSKAIGTNGCSTELEWRRNDGREIRY